MGKTNQLAKNPARKLRVVRPPDKLTVSPRGSTKITGFGVNATYDLLRSGQMPAVQVGKKYFIPIAALHKWLETGQNPLSTGSQAKPSLRQE